MSRLNNTLVQLGHFTSWLYEVTILWTLYYIILNKLMRLRVRIQTVFMMNRFHVTVKDTICNEVQTTVWKR